MILGLLEEIVSYFQYLQTQHGDHVAFHNICIPLEGYMAHLAPYNINSNPYCLLVKSNPEVWNACIDRQKKVAKKCEDGLFCGTCYAGMGEYVYPIRDLDGKVLGFISLSGYRLREKQALSKMRHFAQEFGFSFAELKRVYEQALLPPPEDTAALYARIAPLGNMFVLLYHALIALPTSCVEGQRQSNILSHALVYIQKNYTQELRAEQIANYCHCSISTLSHLFKKHTGMSIPEYICTLRIENGKRLLQNTGLTVEQISDALGFCNPNYFCSRFREMEGISPSGFRRREQARKETSYEIF